MEKPYGYSKYQMIITFPHYSFLTLGAVLLLNIWNVYAFFNKYVFVHW